MVTRMDREIGRMLAALKELNLEENTIVIFTSDNGPLYDQLGGTDTDFFASANGFRGRKGSLYEGGVRVWDFFDCGAKVTQVIVDIIELIAARNQLGDCNQVHGGSSAQRCCLKRASSPFVKGRS
jgi:hypothetical protein